MYQWIEEEIFVMVSFSICCSALSWQTLLLMDGLDLSLSYALSHSRIKRSLNLNEVKTMSAKSEIN